MSSDVPATRVIVLVLCSYPRRTDIWPSKTTYIVHLIQCNDLYNAITLLMWSILYYKASCSGDAVIIFANFVVTLLYFSPLLSLRVQALPINRSTIVDHRMRQSLILVSRWTAFPLYQLVGEGILMRQSKVRVCNTTTRNKLELPSITIDVCEMLRKVAVSKQD